MMPPFLPLAHEKGLHRIVLGARGSCDESSTVMLVREQSSDQLLGHGMRVGRAGSTLLTALELYWGQTVPVVFYREMQSTSDARREGDERSPLRQETSLSLFLLSPSNKPPPAL